MNLWRAAGRAIWRTHSYQVPISRPAGRIIATLAVLACGFIGYQAISVDRIVSCREGSKVLIHLRSPIDREIARAGFAELRTVADQGSDLRRAVLLRQLRMRCGVVESAGEIKESAVAQLAEFGVRLDKFTAPPTKSSIELVPIAAVPPSYDVVDTFDAALLLAPTYANEFDSSRFVVEQLRRLVIDRRRNAFLLNRIFNSRS